MTSKLPETTRSTYARQLADEAKTLVPGVERLGEIVAELRADDLYQTLGFDTWERFCADYIGVTKRTANRWIGTWKQTAIPARSTEQPKSISAGQSVAAGQNVPVVESDTLKSDKSPEGLDQRDHIGSALPTEPSGAVSANDPPTPSGKSSAGNGEGQVLENGPRSPLTPSSGGARATAPPPRRDAPTEVPPASRPAPPGPNPTGPVPSLRQEASAAFRALHDATEGIGEKWTAEEATYWENRSKREVDAWRAAHGIASAPPAKPQRRQGTITRPQAAVLAGRAIEQLNGTAGRPSTRVTIPTIPAPKLAKRHADDCRCLSCVPPKAVAK